VQYTKPPYGAPAGRSLVPAKAPVKETSGLILRASIAAGDAGVSKDGPQTPHLLQSFDTRGLAGARLRMRLFASACDRF
jgi:hypothetical protein